MAGARTYLDHNATAPLNLRARAAMIAALELPGNPSSVHGEGCDAMRAIEVARGQVARLIGASAREIVFTSGATESNNWVISAPWHAVVTSAVEHDSVLAPAKSVCAAHHVVGVNTMGVVNLDALESVLGAHLPRVDDGDDADVEGIQESNAGTEVPTVLVSIQAVNGETGVVQSLDKVRTVVDRYRGALLHVDAVQLRACHRDVLRAARADFVSLSAHKIAGPKGVGALFVRAGLSLCPMIIGGGQELRRRSGTQNVAGISGFGVAAEAAVSAEGLAAVERMQALRDEAELGALAIAPNAFVVAAGAERVCNTSYICVPGVRAETLVMALDLEGIAVSAGSACSSGKVASSHVLKAMGYDDALAGSAIRVSLGPTTNQDDIAHFLRAFGLVMDRLSNRDVSRVRDAKKIA